MKDNVEVEAYVNNWDNKSVKHNVCFENYVDHNLAVKVYVTNYVDDNVEDNL